MAKIDLYIGELSFQGIQCTIPWTDDHDGTQTSLNFRITKILSNGQAQTLFMPDIQRKIELNTANLDQMLDDSINKKVFFRYYPMLI